MKSLGLAWNKSTLYLRMTGLLVGLVVVTLVPRVLTIVVLVLTRLMDATSLKPIMLLAYMLVLRLLVAMLKSCLVNGSFKSALVLVLNKVIIYGLLVTLCTVFVKNSVLYAHSTPSPSLVTGTVPVFTPTSQLRLCVMKEDLRLLSKP
eukprot:c13129_g1_i1.p2 GENE.c13129_g1_i1~~c13129_g1_i1.p2  ORF type:complete len:148 (+),score=13.58 c13129_g1_i1:435-878(+)